MWQCDNEPSHHHPLHTLQRTMQRATNQSFTLFAIVTSSCSTPVHLLHFTVVNGASTPFFYPPFSRKNWRKEKRFQRKCVTLWGRLTPSTSQNMPCGSHLNSKNNYLPTFSASQKPMSSTRWKSSETKHNYLTHNYLIGINPVYSGWTSKGLISTKIRVFSRPTAIFAIFIGVFVLANPSLAQIACHIVVYKR